MRASVRFCYFFIYLQIVFFIGVKSRLLTHDHNHFPLSGTDQSPETQQLNLNLLNKGDEARKMKQEEIYNKKLGSSPPSCVLKCYGCMPCEPTQVPTDTSKFGLQYTNYEPEGWKCKCGPSFYSP